MLPKTDNIKSRISVPLLFFVGAVFVLFPIFFYTTWQNIQRRQENITHHMLEKGAVLIRAFEAGTRAGMMDRNWGKRRLRQLLTETAQQPDIVYLLITDNRGRIIVHNDPVKSDSIHDETLDFEEITESDDLKWRLVTNGDRKIFEVFSKFTPSGRFGGPGRMHMMRQRHRRRFPFRPDTADSIPRGIFIGFDIQTLEAGKKAFLLNSIITGSILLLAASAGIFLLFLFQNYRTAKTSLSRIKAFSDNVVENMPIGLLAMDGDKRLTSMNSVAESVLGLSRDAMAGLNAERVLPRELWEQLDRFSLEKEIVEEEIECIVGSDRRVPLEVSASVLRSDNETFGYILLLKDLTEVRTLRREIARSQRLASLGKLAAGVAHEVRNPLSSIKGFATYFKERYRDVPRDQRTAGIMIQEVERLDRVVGQLLELAKPVNISAKPTPAAPFIASSLKLVEQQALEKNIEIRTDMPNKVGDIRIDRDKISQVLLNLYLNAIDAMEDGGLLTVKLLERSGNGQTEISVADTGLGISRENLTKVFDPYFTTKSTGTGLGLAIVHNIIEAHGGRIKAESQPGGGAVFTATLPKLDEESDDER